MKKIKLTKGRFAIVDDMDFEKINKNTWKLTIFKKSNKIYATRTQHYYLGKKKYKSICVFMHREVLGLKYKDGVIADHKNGNTLDNTRGNLRPSNKSQNSANSGLSKTNTSGYKGVRWNKKNKIWASIIRANNIRYNLGCYKDIRIAAKMWNCSARIFHGQFAYQNII